MWTLWDQSTWHVTWLVAVFASVLAAYTDLRSRRIPNAITLPLLLCGLVWSTMAGGLLGLSEAIVAVVVMGAPYVILYAVAGGGAGDAKMMGALGAWLGLIGGMVALLSVAVCGGLIAFLYAWKHRRLKFVLLQIYGAAVNMVYWLRGVNRLKQVQQWVPAHQHMQQMPYGLAIMTGTSLAAGGVWLWRS